MFASDGEGVMDWNAPTWWWLGAGALVAAELATGTFYLLMLAVGAVAGAVAAHAGQTLALQWATAALLGAGATGVWHWKRSQQPVPEPSARNRDVNIDIGQTVQVAAWAQDGSARVIYRGSTWAVRLEGHGAPRPGEHTIVSVHSGFLGVVPVSTR
jgi:membrane protein implicated in regulation of membrane protease activity